jgi:hypothetical protein
VVALVVATNNGRSRNDLGTGRFLHEVVHLPYKSWP